MKRRTAILSLMMLCSLAHGGPGEGTLPWEDTDSRALQQEQIVREMKLAGWTINEGPWDLASNNSLGRMNEYVVVWYKPKDTQTVADFCLFGQDEKLLHDITYNRTTFAKSEKLNKEKILKNSFTFNTPDEVRTLAQKLYNGEAMPKAYLCVLNKTNMAMDRKFLCLHPHGFFFFLKSYSTKPSSYWTMSQDFHREANSFSNITLRTEIRSIRDDATRREARLEELIVSTMNQEIARREAAATLREEEMRGIMQENRAQSLLIVSTHVKELKEKLEALELSRKEEVAHREAEKQEQAKMFENVLSRMEDLRKKIEEEAQSRAMMQQTQAFIQQAFIKQMSEMLSRQNVSQASSPEEDSRRGMEQMMQQMQEMNASIVALQASRTSSREVHSPVAAASEGSAGSSAHMTEPASSGAHSSTWDMVEMESTT